MSASEYAELLDHLGQIVALTSAGPTIAGRAAAAIRALEAKVREAEMANSVLSQSRSQWIEQSGIYRAARDRLAEEVERLKAACLALHAKRSQDVDERNAEVARLTAELATARENDLFVAIERAAGELPEGVEIGVCVERNSAWVELDGVFQDGADMTLAEHVNELVDAARRAGGEG